MVDGLDRTRRQSDSKLLDSKDAEDGREGVEGVTFHAPLPSVTLSHLYHVAVFPDAAALTEEEAGAVGGVHASLADGESKVAQMHASAEVFDTRVRTCYQEYNIIPYRIP